MIGRWVAMGLLAAALVPLMPTVALAGSGGRKNTAIGLTAGAAAAWLNGGTKSAGRRNTAIGLTAASVVAWHKHKKAKRAERRQARLARIARTRHRSAARVSAHRRSAGRRSQSAYRTGYRAGYRAGVRRGARA